MNKSPKCNFKYHLLYLYPFVYADKMYECVWKRDTLTRIYLCPFFVHCIAEEINGDGEEGKEQGNSIISFGAS